MPQRPRGGNAYTPGSTGSNDRQSSGATFRMLVDLADWDSTLGTNSPGQSGDPDSPFYSNLYEDWAKDVYFPMYFSLEKIKPYLVRNAIIVFDEFYNYLGWKNGEFKALNEVFNENEYIFKGFNLEGEQCYIQIK